MIEANQKLPQVKSAFSNQTLWIILCLIILTFGSSIRFFRLDRQSIWLDEAYSVIVSSRTVPEIIDQQLNDSSPPLYYILLHYWQHVFGKSEYAVRSFSALFGSILIAVIMLLAHRLGGREAAIWAGLLASVSPTLVFYSQETRMYSLSMLTATLAIMASLQRQSKAKWINPLFVVSMAMCIYTQSYGWLIWIGIISYGVFSGQLRSVWRDHCFVALLVIGALIMTVWQMRQNATPWIQYPQWKDLFYTARYFAGDAFHIGVNGAVERMIQVNMLILFVLILTGFLSTIRSHQLVWIPVWIIFGPIALAFAISHFKPIFYAGRSEMIILPVLIAWLAGILMRIRSLSIIRFILVVFIVVQIAPLVHYFNNYQKDTARSAASMLTRNNVSDRDVIITADLSEIPLRYYLKDRMPMTFPFPRGSIGWLPKAMLDADPEFIRTEIAWIQSQIAKLPPDVRVFLVVANNIHGNHSLEALLEREMVRKASWVFESEEIWNRIHKINFYRTPN